jgi:predicted dehydrogenase
MNEISRRLFAKKLTKAGIGASAFTIIKPELVRGAGKAKLKAGVVGCGGRGTQAIVDFLTGTENTEVSALGDIFKDKMDNCVKRVKGNARISERVTATPETTFIGFDSYKKVIGSGVDIVFLCAPSGHRPIHFEASIDAKKHVFCEKPMGTDPVGVKRFMAAARRSERMRLTVVTGAQRRFARDYQETVKRLQDGAIGDIVATYAYWVGTPVIQQKGRDPKWGEMEWQHRNWYSFNWICGDQVVEQHMHNIDVCNWVMGMHPKSVVASGGAAWRPREELYGNIYDHITAEFKYPNGVHMFSHCRQFPRVDHIHQNVSELVVGTKGRSNCRDLSTGSGQDVRAGFRDPLESPYVREHIAMVDSIRGEGPFINHAMEVAESTMTCIMAREAAYSGQEITWDEIMASNLDISPKEFDYQARWPVPPLPVPGVYKFESFPRG